MSFSRTIEQTGESQGAGLVIAMEQCTVHQIDWFDQSLVVSAADISPGRRKWYVSFQLVDREIVSMECAEHVHTAI